MHDLETDPSLVRTSKLYLKILVYDFMNEIHIWWELHFLFANVVYFEVKQIHIWWELHVWLIAGNLFWKNLIQVG